MFGWPSSRSKYRIGVCCARIKCEVGLGWLGEDGRAGSEEEGLWNAYGIDEATLENLVGREFD